MSLIATLEKNTSVRSITLGQLDGSVTYHKGYGQPDEIIANSVLISQTLTKLGDDIGLGALSYLIIHNSDVTIIMPKQSQLASVCVEKCDEEKSLDILKTEKWQAVLTETILLKSEQQIPEDSTNNITSLPSNLSMSPEHIQDIIDGSITEKALSGKLKDFSLPDLLEFLRTGHRTGSLICYSQNGVGVVELDKGFISCATVPNVDNIGSLLLKKGKIPKERIEEAVKSQLKDLSEIKIGALLVEKGIVDVKSMKDALTEQTFSAIQTMLDWQDGRFVFTPTEGNLELPESVSLKIDSQFILMKLCRISDEKNR